MRRRDFVALTAFALAGCPVLDGEEQTTATPSPIQQPLSCDADASSVAGVRIRSDPSKFAVDHPDPPPVREIVLGEPSSGHDILFDVHNETRSETAATLRFETTRGDDIEFTACSLAPGEWLWAKTEIETGYEVTVTPSGPFEAATRTFQEDDFRSYLNCSFTLTESGLESNVEILL